MFDISNMLCYNAGVGKARPGTHRRLNPAKGESAMRRNGLSAKQEEILNYIKEEILSKGYPPAVREICSAVGLRSTDRKSVV